MASEEITVYATSPSPNGYIFVSKGNSYITRNCRLETKAARRNLYVVKDDKSKILLGIRCPRFVFFKVKKKDKETAAARSKIVIQKDSRLTTNARAILALKFPRIPQEDVDRVIKHAFRRGSGRIGRCQVIEEETKVVRAVYAHIRHKHTKYDELLKQTENAHKRSGSESRKVARDCVAPQIKSVLRSWGYEIPRGSTTIDENRNSSAGRRNFVNDSS
ncbi:hypothetical protein MMC25_003992 [Agyrium rufum]|nr:hypothetical protein [Agyrium rufum]